MTKPSENSTELASVNSTNSALSLGSEILTKQGYRQRSKNWNDYISHTMDVWYRWDSDTEASFAWYVEPMHLNAAKVLHGGAMTTFLDHCMGAFCYNLTEGKFAHTLQMSTQFLHPVRANRWLMCDVVHAAGSKQMIQLEADVRIVDLNRWPTLGVSAAKAHSTFLSPKR